MANGIPAGFELVEEIPAGFEVVEAQPSIGKTSPELNLVGPELALGVADAAVSLGSSIIAEPVAGIAGMLSSPFTDEGGSGQVVRDFREALTISPSTSGGKQIATAAGAVLEKTGIPQALIASEEFFGDIGLSIAGPVGGGASGEQKRG